MDDRRQHKCPEGIGNKYDMKAAILEYASPMVENMFTRLRLPKGSIERDIILEELVNIMWLGLEMSSYYDFDFFEELENTIHNIEREHR